MFVCIKKRLRMCASAIVLSINVNFYSCVPLCICKLTPILTHMCGTHAKREWRETDGSLWFKMNLKNNFNICFCCFIIVASPDPTWSFQLNANIKWMRWESATLCHFAILWCISNKMSFQVYEIDDFFSRMCMNNKRSHIPIFGNKNGL